MPSLGAPSSPSAHHQYPRVLLTISKSKNRVHGPIEYMVQSSLRSSLSDQPTSFQLSQSRNIAISTSFMMPNVLATALQSVISALACSSTTLHAQAPCHMSILCRGVDPRLSGALGRSTLPCIEEGMNDAVTWPSAKSTTHPKTHQPWRRVKGTRICRRWMDQIKRRITDAARLRAPSKGTGFFRRRPAAAACFSTTSYPSPARPAERRTTCCPGPPNALRRYGHAPMEAIEAGRGMQC